MRNKLILLLFLIVLGSCERQAVSEQELKAYVIDPDNGLVKKYERNDVSVSAIYRPEDLVKKQQLDGVTDRVERERIIANFDSLTFFILKLSRKGQEIESTYSSDNQKFVQVINYLSTTIAQDVFLVHEDTIPAIDVTYTQMFGSSGETSVMAVFDTDLKRKSGSLKLRFDDNMFGLGLVDFEFDLNDIKRIPTLTLN